MLQNWISKYLSEESNDLPFSFIYNGSQFSTLGWEVKRSKTVLDENRTQQIVTYTDPATKLEVRCVWVEYSDYPNVEWTVYIKNTGKADTPVIENVLGIDAIINSENVNDFVLHHFDGSNNKFAEYRPYETHLNNGDKIDLKSVGGRSSESIWPYFNLECGNQGAIIAIGWPGQWVAELSCVGEKSLSIKAGQERTHFILHPGEEVRTPLIVMQFWQGGNWIDAQNMWRRFMVDHNSPKDHGKPIRPMLTCVSSDQFDEMTQATAKDQLYFIDRYLEEGIKMDYWWMDAGWYPCDGVWQVTGNWEVDKKRFPNGLREVNEHAHSKDIETIVWFEPERVQKGSWLCENHPDWIIGSSMDGQQLLNLGNPDAWNWVVNHFDKIITDEKIDLYRQDCNIAPLGQWRKNDTPDRQGITENKHVMGYLAYWDELQKRHPGMLIDACASGGKRNDVETMRRAIPLWRTDECFEANSAQCHSYGISFWIPVSGAGVREIDDYNFRSSAVPSFGFHADARNKDENFDLYRKQYKQWRQYSPNFMGDYYPLTDYSPELDNWLAWQFDRPEVGEGMVQAFRRPENDDSAKILKLFRLDREAQYTVTNIDTDVSIEMSGSDLMATGLTVDIPNKPGAVVYLYKKK